MKKFIMLSALVAATSTAFVACSSDDDLAQQPKAPETIGTPVKVVLDGTRANLDNTTTANLSSFQLYGIQQTPTKNFWMDNVKFTKSGSDWGSTSNPTWPVSNKDVVTNFYGFADGVTDGVPAGLTPSIDADAQSFTFTFGDGAESTQYHSIYTQTYIDGLSGGLKNNRQNTRNSQVSTQTVLDNNNLTDLLVTYDGLESGKDQISGVEGTDGSVNLNFKHALSNLVIKAMFVGDQVKYYWPDGTQFWIEWIRVYGLYTSGTYTFGSGWTFGGTDNMVVYQKVFGEEDSATPDPRWTMEVTPYATYTALDAAGKKATYKTIVGPGEFMVIPQDYSSRAYVGYQTPNVAPVTDGTQCMIELYGYFKTPADAAVDKGNKNYFPLKVTSNTFVAGKQQVVVLDLTEMLNVDGGHVAEPSQAGGN